MTYVFVSFFCPSFCVNLPLLVFLYKLRKIFLPVATIY
uniref:Uncharacterized protein n=1 Tax=Rhizophora mucronata TaxID=61149 RepID=A0A2P2PAW4_RHIMU